MLFPTLTFALFFLTVYPVCWLLRWRHWAWKLFVLLASYVFYGSWDRRFVFLIFLSSVLNYAAARALYRQGPERQTGRRAVLLAALVFNLGLLGVFKYYGFFVESLNEALRGAGFGGRLPFVEVIVPVGISFFTFQAISYVVDVYRGSLAPGRWLDFAVYLAFFPHLVAGPIVRASEFLPQLNVPRTLLPRNATRAALLIGRGLFKKVVISSYVATAIVDPVFGVPGQHSSPEILLAIYGYAVQIYADFSGYTDIAIGIALLLGIGFPQNFDRPYSAVSMQDFWRRWHMTLSRWLRDYLYIPLGGSRHGTLATYRNLMLTMALGGLWHGASLTFLAWGVFHGIGLALERLVVGLAALLRPPGSRTRPRGAGRPARLGRRRRGPLAGAPGDVQPGLRRVGPLPRRLPEHGGRIAHPLRHRLGAGAPGDGQPGGGHRRRPGHPVPPRQRRRPRRGGVRPPPPPAARGGARGLLRRRGGLRPARRCPLHLLSVLNAQPDPDPALTHHSTAQRLPWPPSPAHQAHQAHRAHRRHPRRLRPPPAPPGPFQAGRRDQRRPCLRSARFP